ncbi:hypothetical protein Csa_000807 [Cucumis sativus]|uniref:Uncharacterized protein n=1 Tax=Cucumis sativus TaxID=3659 RepID=A0A0A0LCT8_CUCSA|nr:hypothetical protein Csa_000807 [Cucumis sativus]
MEVEGVTSICPHQIQFFILKIGVFKMIRRTIVIENLEFDFLFSLSFLDLMHFRYSAARNCAADYREFSLVSWDDSCVIDFAFVYGHSILFPLLTRKIGCQQLTIL